jgi:predicted DCC family thiol-disulfide oxidoreductase YuxK
MTNSGPIVFFDGVCGLCNSSVDFFMRQDREGRLKFAPLQGETAAACLAATDRENLSSLVFFHDGVSMRKSSGVVQILRQLGGVWKLLAGLLWIIPKPLRDLGYTCVATFRYRLFGKKETCRMPTAEERGRILN